MNLLCINALCFIISSILLLNVNERFENRFEKSKIFLFMIGLNLLLLLIDSVVRTFSGIPGEYARTISTIFRYMVFLTCPLPAYLWLKFVGIRLMRKRKSQKHLATLAFTIYILYIAFVGANPFNHGLFYIDGENQFSRGPLFMLLPVVCGLYLIFSYVVVWRYRRRAERRMLLSLLIFALPAIAGGILQIFNKSLSLYLAGSTVSLLLIYVDILNRRIYTDYLTGLFNRREADNYLLRKISQKDAENSFSAIMIDVDKFKEINDRFGHNTGDEALEDVARILKRSLRANDFIARYGGDEFLVVFNIGQTEILKKAVRRIKNAVNDFNAQSKKPYRLSLSMGYSVYSGDGFYRNSKLMNADQFLKHIDTLMYQDKLCRADDQLSFLESS